ncbi:MAG: sigma-54-dependent Fis family transcriptional regulator [Deltaproteobacteria bacterium]|nr:sigma-54-dependent Fis family transcriptional regulator [Deltaproteobacteria bacterium]MBI3016595.1 sigma-54-dependent Fis family transcriptional regulator [Deltaproteobacteria bacterium]
MPSQQLKDQTTAKIQHILHILQEKNPYALSALEDIHHNTLSLCDALDLKEKEADILRSHLHEKTQFGFIFSKSHLMQKMFWMAEKYKESALPLLILAEKGCGKEALARAVHLKSNRQGPFLVYDGIQSLEVLLKPKDSTLYFPEVSLVTPEKQKKLLECLQLAPTHTRIIISAQKSAEVEDSIYHRVRSMTLTILPLRERKEDILPLIDTFVREFSQNEKNISRFSSSALTKFADYSWPGNISELKLEIKRILIDNPGVKYFSIEHLPEKIIGASLKELFSIIQNTESLPKAMELLERKMVLESLMKHHWNKSKVSRELGISRSGLIQKVEKYNIRPIHFSKFSETKRRMSARNSGFISVN